MSKAHWAQGDDAYFDWQVADTAKFWRRFGGRPDLAGRDVLDLGCGHGALTIDMVRHGARHATGLDISEQRIAYARANVARRYADLAPRLDFLCQDLTGLPQENRFDAIVSKDTFEHITDLPAVLQAIRRLLRPGGALYAGFSPLWYSPFGDHGELGSFLPWGHVIAGKRRVVEAYNRSHQADCRTLEETGYNGLTFAEFMARFAGSGLTVESVRLNPAEGRAQRLAMTMFDALRRIGPLEPYFTVGVYAVLRKPPG